MQRTLNGCLSPYVLGSLLLVALPAQANIDQVGVYDARVAGMGDTGVAYMEGASAVYHNPASLQSIQKLHASVSVASVLPGVTHGSAPLDGPDTEVSATINLVPGPFLGVGYRLSDRIVVGLAAYPLEAYGGSFQAVQSLGGFDYSGLVATIEASPAVSIALLDNLSLGLGYRITYIREQAKSPVAFGGTFLPSKSDFSGTNFEGIRVGLAYRPLESLRFGLSYRSKVTTTIKGKLKLVDMEVPGFPTEGIAVTTEIASPHRVKGGVAYSLLGGRLLLAFDAKLLFYKDSHQVIVSTAETPLGTQTDEKPLHWKNVLGLGFGAEYAVNPMVALRLGYSTTDTASPEETVDYFTSQPARSHGIHAGAGLRLERWNFDLGVVYSIAQRELAPALTNPGRYGGAGMGMSLSASYQL